MFDRSHRFRSLFIAALLIGISLLPVAHAKRLALVIGNDTYQSLQNLQNAGSDARAIAKALEAHGFSVTLKTDLDERAFRTALRDFRRTVEGGDDVVFYYAGHGVQIGGSNYLLPSDIGYANEDQVKDESIPLQRVLDDLQEQKARFTLAIVDACRDNPFQASGRNIGGRGLQPINPATGQMVLYSAGAGQQALDRLSKNDRDPNGLFTRILLKEINRPGVPVDRMLRNVRDQVVRLAQGVKHEQVPALYDQTIGDFYFKRGTPEASLAPSLAPSLPAGPAAPTSSGLDLADLQKEEKRRGDWAAWQTRMQTDYNTVNTLKGGADLKAKAWERFLAAYPQDNPYSNDDERLRETASQAKREAEQQSVKVAMAIPPQSLGSKQRGRIADRYQDNGDGTVTEVTTGLQWKRCAEGQTWTGSTCSGDASKYNLDQARALRSRFAGHTDWRLPTIDELKSLVYCSNGQPKIWNDSGDGCEGEYDRPTIQAEAFPNTPSSYFWSGSPLAGNTGNAWGVYFSNGYAGSSSRYDHDAVRLVRGGQ